MEAWKKSFAYIADVCGVIGLRILREAVVTDDPALIQGITANYDPYLNPEARRVCGACAVGYMYWKAEGMEYVDDVEDAVAATFAAVSDRTGVTGAAGYFTGYYDGTPRDEMRRELLPEIDVNIRRLTEFVS